MTEPAKAVVAVSSKTWTAIVVLVDKLGVVVFSSGVGVYLAEHAKLDERTALKDAGYAGAIAGLTFLLKAANDWRTKRGV